MRRRNHSAARAMLENLEQRRLLAGNVTAALDGTGVLVVTGDNKANDIRIVAGIDSTTVFALAGTTVNGDTLDVEFDGFPDIVVTTGNGADEVTVVDPLFQNVSINTGNGGDRVEVTAVIASAVTFDDLTIDTGNGDDVVIVNLDNSFGDFISSDLTIRTGNGDDFVRLAGDIHVNGDVLIDGGNGDDTLDDDGLDIVGGSTSILNIETII